MMKVNIKAYRDCKYCHGSGRATPFIAYASNAEDGKVICKCILEQINIIPNKKKELDADEKIGNK